MRSTLKSLLILLLLIPGIAFSQDEITEDVRGTSTFEGKIHPDLPRYVFHLIGDLESNTFVRIDVSRESEPTVIQSLQIPEADRPYRGTRYFQLEDVNFDGYSDIKLLSFSGATGNGYYYYWLFDRKTDQFVFSQEFSKFCNPILHPETREIETHAVRGKAGMIYIDETFRVIDGRPVLVRRESEDEVDRDGRSFLKVVREVKNGKMKIVSREIVKNDLF